jgi:hypothetical protein
MLHSQEGGHALAGGVDESRGDSMTNCKPMRHDSSMRAGAGAGLASLALGVVELSCQYAFTGSHSLCCASPRKAGSTMCHLVYRTRVG